MALHKLIGGVRFRIMIIQQVMLTILVAVSFAEQQRFGLPSATVHVEVHDDDQMSVLSIDLTSTQFDPQQMFAQPSHRNHLHRSVRSADNSPTSVTADLHGDKHTTLIVHWAGEGSSVILALAKNASEEDATALHVSYDYGKTFEDVNPRMTVETTDAQAILYKYYTVEKFNTHYLFTDIHNHCIFTTDDSCKTFVRHCGLHFKPRTLSLHRDNPRYLLGLDEESELKELYLSSDFGASWDLVLSNVKAFSWEFEGQIDSSRIYVHELQGDDKGQILRISLATYAKSGSSGRPQADVLLTDVVDFEVKEDYIFATKSVRLFGSHGHGPTLQLWISHKGEKFEKAEFPLVHNISDFFVADVSEGQLMVCVSLNESYSNLYISDVNSYRFSLSLERVVYFNPKTTSNKDRVKSYSNKTFVDVTKIEGVGGIYIASQQVGTGVVVDHQVSLISFDKGGFWQPITPPEYDLDGRKSTCTSDNDCTLHLTQMFSQLFPESRASPILTQPSAPGLVIASGMLGKNLKGDPDVFVSSSAGIRWRVGLSGLYQYATTDQGGIIAAIHQLEPTDELLYSIDEGETWQSFKFSQSPMRIYGLLTEPGENTTVFTVFGSPLLVHSWTIIQVDMKDVFQGKKCVVSDYKMWSVNDELPKEDGCLLGHVTLYQRRNAHAACYNGKDFVREVQESNCVCTREDFECDFGYIEDNQAPDLCVRDSSIPDNMLTQVPDSCPPGTYYNYTRGYRKVPGDTCSGGQDHRYSPIEYACPVKEDGEFLLITGPGSLGRLDLATGTRRELLSLQHPPEVPAIFDWDKNLIITVSSDGAITKWSMKSDVLLPGPSSSSAIKSLAYDWTGHNVFYLEVEKNSPYKAKLGVVNIYYRFTRTLYSNLHDVRSLVLDPHDGYLYFIGAPQSSSQAGTNNHFIYRAAMDGSDQNPVVVVNSTLLVDRDSPMVFDEGSGQLFWKDAKTSMILSAQVSGHSLGTPSKSSASELNIPAVVRLYNDNSNMGQVSGLAIYKGYMYFSYRESPQVMMAPLNYLSRMTVFGDYPGGALGMFLVSSHHSKSACSPYNPPCSQLCLPAPSSGASGSSAHNRTCLCGDSYKRNKTSATGRDETCQCEAGEVMEVKTGLCLLAPNASSCADDMFTCSNGRCVRKTFQCDGDDDCHDGSDEMDCAYENCKSDSFTCHSGHCIPLHWRCDQEDDCKDGMESDELGCANHNCTKGQFQCKNKFCIMDNWVCDGDNDCHDGSDEENCNHGIHNRTCSPWEFTCDSGDCIDSFFRCNGRMDCYDRSDERGCDAYTCADHEFACKDVNNTCILSDWLCDGEEECPNGNDEKDCPTPGPTSDTSTRPFHCVTGFTCDNTLCISWSEVCDWVPNCRDGTDERDCGRPSTTTTPRPAGTDCRDDQFSCKVSGGRDGCVSLSARCDGQVDCSDGRDEEDCGEKCTSDQFECKANSTCIWKSWVCDGSEDCPMGEDEKDCKDAQTCSRNEWACVKSGGCVPATGRCDRKVDCDDASDELGCREAIDCSIFDDYLTACCMEAQCGVYITSIRHIFFIFEKEEGHCKPIEEAVANAGHNHCGTKLPVEYECGKNQFSCDFDQRCVSYTQVCNSHNDCFNNRDEIFCECDEVERRIPPAIAELGNTSVTWIMDTDDNGYSNFSYAPVEDGFPVANLSWVHHKAASDRLLKITGLKPAQLYSFVFNYKNKRCVTESVSVQMEDGIPSEPRNFEVHVDPIVEVFWKRPLSPRGVIKFYMIYYQQINDDGTAATDVYEETFSMVQGTNRVANADSQIFSLILSADNFQQGKTYHFWIAAETSAGVGPSTDKVTATVTPGPDVSLKVTSKLLENGVQLSWTKRSKVNRYKVTVSVDDAVASIPDTVYILDKSKTSLKIKDLCPGSTPKVSVAVKYVDSQDYQLHSEDTIKIPLHGTSPKAQIEKVEATGATSVLLSYKVENKNVTDNNYFIYYTHDLSEEPKNMSAWDTTINLQGLFACERYLVWVRASYLTCPASQIQTFLTQEDPKAPPRHVHAQPVRKDDIYVVTLTWRASCGHDVLDLGYIINIKMGDDPEREFRQKFTSKDAIIKMDIPDVMPGLTYKFKVRTDLAGSKSSEPVEVTIPSLDGPINLVVFTIGPKSVFVRWDWPPRVDSPEFKEFVLHYVGPDGESMTNHTSVPELALPLGEVGAYKFTVTVMDQQDRVIAETRTPYVYMFEPNVDQPSSPDSGGDDSMSSGHLVAILVPVTLVGVALSAALVFFIVRHRRLQRSFLAFANSHYNIQSGTTTFSDDLEGDEPMIQGFADDEPLVIA